jgi:hypothetical protein
LQRHGYVLHRVDGDGKLVPVSPERSTEVRAENWVGLRADD